MAVHFRREQQKRGKNNDNGGSQPQQAEEYESSLFFRAGDSHVSALFESIFQKDGLHASFTGKHDSCRDGQLVTFGGACPVDDGSPCRPHQAVRGSDVVFSVVFPGHHGIRIRFGAKTHGIIRGDAVTKGQHG